MSYNDGSYLAHTRPAMLDTMSSGKLKVDCHLDIHDNVRKVLQMPSEVSSSQDSAFYEEENFIKFCRDTQARVTRDTRK